MACARGLQWILENAPWLNVTRIYIVTDSLYLVENHSRVQYWKKGGWRNLAGEPIANDDLWDEILKLIAKVSKMGLRVDFHWQKGKKSALGKKVDAAAKAAAQRAGFDEDFGYQPGSYSRSMVPGGAAAERYPASGQIEAIRPYMKRIRSGREEKISFNLFHESMQIYTGKFFAYADPSLSVELHKGNGHRVRFNSDPKFPRILERIESVVLPKPAGKKRAGGAPPKR